MSNQMMKQEIQEAIMAGDRALRSLRAAKEKLNSAKNWGIVDLLGGGLITDLIKHSKMRDASRYLDEARYDLKRFQKELNDVDSMVDLNVDMGDFLTFADFFFDGLVADFMAQSRIADARRKIDDAIGMVEKILVNLRNQYGYW